MVQSGGCWPWYGKFFILYRSCSCWWCGNHCKWIFRSFNSVSLLLTDDIRRNKLEQNCSFRTYVTFDKSTRVVGQASKAMEVTNPKNTICNFKRLIGRRYQDLFVQQEKDLNTYSIFEGKGGSVNIEVSFLFNLFLSDQRKIPSFR